VVKKGVQSYSPFKVTVRHEENQNDNKSRFGPPKINLDDADLATIVNTVKLRSSMEKLPATSLPIGHYTDYRSKSNMRVQGEDRVGYSLNQKLYMTRDSRALDNYSKYL
jgi:hypothetical protein